MKKVFVAVFAIASVLQIGAKEKDPVAMTINGKDVKLSEFEYLYNKNQKQQIEEQPFDKYVDMFVTYKLKVADAEAAGIDTTQKFLKEFSGYRNDLVKQFFVDTTTNKRLAREAYNRMKEDVDVWHIMLNRDSRTEGGVNVQKLFADSLRKAIIDGAEFSDVAMKYSIDGSKNNNLGHMGYISYGLTPYTFEYAAYNTPLGTLSEVVETPFGYHIIKPVAKRPAKGTVYVAHILCMFPMNAIDEQKEEVRQKADSIYNLIVAGGDFEKLALQYSDDKASAQRGGKLPWFGVGRMIPEFEKVSYELSNDEVSKPFETRFGYHIVKKLDSKPVPEYAEVEKQIISSFANDERANMATAEGMEKIKKANKYNLYNQGLNEIIALVEKNDTLTADVIKELSESKTPLISFNKTKFTVGDFVNQLEVNSPMPEDLALRFLKNNINDFGENALRDEVSNEILKTNSDLRNLINEYKDGLMLFEISNEKIWNKAAQDTEGLEAYFNANRNKYDFATPRFKGYLISVANDSLATITKSMLQNLPEDSIVPVLRRTLKAKVKIEKVLVAQGDNKLVDAAGFTKKYDAKSPNTKLPVYFTHLGRIITKPESVNDVKGQAIVDYQNELEKQWIADMKNKYPVSINKKVLSKANKK